MTQPVLVIATGGIGYDSGPLISWSLYRAILYGLFSGQPNAN